MKFVELSTATIININDISHVHVITDSNNKEVTAHVFMVGSYPQSRVIITQQEFDVLKTHLLPQ